MNVLSPAQRSQILDLCDGGATIREIARRVGCDRQTVANYVGRGSIRTARARRLACALFDWIEARGLDAGACAPLLDLMHELGSTCPYHPEAVAGTDVDFDAPCRLCQRDGMRRHHARRKAEGRPILPPRRRREAK